MQTLGQGVSLGLRNFWALFLALLLYVITLWIPYLNVGTTVGMYRLVINISKGDSIDPLSIFEKENFSQLGDVFLLLGFMTMGCVIALLFMVIPFFVISIAWMFAVYAMVDKKVTPTVALSLSYRVTMGEKWRLFLLEVIMILAISLVSALFAEIPVVGPILSFLASLVSVAIVVGILAVMYRHFSEKMDSCLPEVSKAESLNSDSGD